MVIKHITQGMLETWQHHVVSHAADLNSAAHYERVVIEGAIKAEMVTDVPDDLTACDPWEVLQLAAEIAAAIDASQAPPAKN